MAQQSEQTPYWNESSVEDLVSARSKILGPAVWAAAQPDPRPVISFGGGLPDVPSLPGEALLKAARAVVDREQREALQYGGTFGPLPLREALAGRSSGIEGIPVTTEHVIISSGAAHGIGIACETVLDPGDVVLVESPTFPGSLRTLRSFGAEIVAVPMDEQGLRVDALEEAIARLAAEGKRAKLLYCIPTHQNPAGNTLPLARRERILELAREHRFVALEDDAYGEIWFDAPPPPSLFALSQGELAVKVSSFSKIIATGLRMGWNMGPPALISRMAALRYDMGSSPFLGRVIAEMIRNGDLDRHVERLRDIYGRKIDRLEDAIGRYCSDYTAHARPGGGFFLWLGLRPGLSAIEVARVANERHAVIVGAGPHFFADGRATEHLRVAFSYTPIEEIEEGIHRLGDALAEVAAQTAIK